MSAKQLKKHKEQVDIVSQAKQREAKLDKEFAKRLADLDEEDSVSKELPRRKANA